MDDGRIGHAELRDRRHGVHARGRVPRRAPPQPARRSAAARSRSRCTCPTPTRPTPRAVELGATPLRPIARALRRPRRDAPRPVRSPLVRADRARDRRRAGRGRARPPLRRHRLRHPSRARRRARRPASTARCSVGSSCTVGPEGSTSRRSRRRPASRTGSRPRSARLLPRRRHRLGRGSASASSAARCCRSATTTPAATPSASTTRALDLFRSPATAAEHSTAG